MQVNLSQVDLVWMYVKCLVLLLLFVYTIFIAALFGIAKNSVVGRILRSSQDSWPLGYRYLFPIIQTLI